MSADVAWLHLQADELAPGSVSLHFLEHVAADEVALAELDRPTKPRLVWVDRFVHIVSPQTKCRLESGRVASTEACRKYARLLAAREDGVPHVAHPVAVDEQLESFLARVTRPRDQGMDPRHAPMPEAEVRDRVESVAWQQLLRARALEGDERGAAETATESHGTTQWPTRTMSSS